MTLRNPTDYKNDIVLGEQRGLYIKTTKNPYVSEIADGIFLCHKVFDNNKWTEIREWLDMTETWIYMRETNPTSDATFAPGYFVTKIYDYNTGDHRLFLPTPEIYNQVFFPFASFVQGDKPTSRIPIRLKANLYPRQSEKIQHEKHVDYFDYETSEQAPWLTKVPVTNMVYMVNDNDGGTEILGTSEGDIMVPSKQNTAVIFPNKYWHRSSVCTDKKCRLTINFNFI
jgi:hypothetical protein